MEIKITLELKDKKIEMNKAEAKELYVILKDLVGEKEILQGWPYPMPYYERTYQPLFWEVENPYRDRTIITCKS